MSVIVLSSVAMLTAWAMWWTWRQRFLSEQLANRARQEARANRELVAAGRAARDLAHDLGNLVAVLHLNLQQLEHDWDEREKARERVRDVQKAAIAMYDRFGEWGRDTGRAQPGSSAMLLSTLCGLVRRTGLTVEPEIEAPMPFSGEEEDMVRVLENLLIAASRESIRAGQPRIEVHMARDQLRIATRIEDAAQLEDRIYEEGACFEGSVGRGITIARQAAARIGWRILHTVEDDQLTFMVLPVDRS